MKSPKRVDVDRNDAEEAKAHITWYELDGPRHADARGTEKLFSNNPVAEQLQTIQEKLPVFLHTHFQL